VSTSRWIEFLISRRNYDDANHSQNQPTEENNNDHNATPKSDAFEVERQNFSGSQHTRLRDDQGPPFQPSDCHYGQRFCLCGKYA